MSESRQPPEGGSGSSQTSPPASHPSAAPSSSGSLGSGSLGSAGETKPLPRMTRPQTDPTAFPVPGGGVPGARPSDSAPSSTRTPNLGQSNMGAPRHPTPPLQQAAQPVANPFQSQMVPQSYPAPPYGPPKTGTQPAPPMGSLPGSANGNAMHPDGYQDARQTGPQRIQTPAHPMAPPAPGSSPRMGNTGAIPALQQQPQQAPVQPQQPQQMFTRQPTGPNLPRVAAAAPRITVQYPQVGSTLKGQRGSYVVRDVIGSGEFGAVYDCIGPFDQIYALKMVRPSNRPYSEVQAEWAREQSRLFSLRHPNVVYIYDSFEQDHLFYLALERCDHALKDMLGTPMQEGLVLEMTRQLLAAVQFLHDNEVVHDDLHAGNVLITHTDRPTVKISDFGISHELRGMTAVRPNVVHHAIMAPEILATGYTSRQSDLYQVGLLLYWMLAGEPAIQMDVPYQELVRQVADGAPRIRAEQLGTPFGDLIAKMLRRREAFRYASAREVWSELRELPAWKQRNLFPVK